MRKITHIVIHCTATVSGREFSTKDIDLWHKKRGWKGIGYHYVIKLDGTIEQGRPEYKIGAHVKGHNRNSIGIVYVGGLNKRLSPKDTRNRKQKRALKSLLLNLKEKYPQAEILGHRDFSRDINKNGIIEPFEFIKACPCFDAQKEYCDL
ncbi:N-acetylmuramoyl-L-alanine amidase [Tenacibaculum jejuense]|nr:N-acetylmuramoyl-L-alanine amidase [Tenacibaculum jejuense]